MIDFNKKFLFVSDVDFSFLAWDNWRVDHVHDDFIPEDNLKALKLLFKNKNFQFSFATGSNPTKRIANLMRLVGMTGKKHAVLSNGALIVEFDLDKDLDYKIVYHSSIPKGDLVLKLTEDFSKKIIEAEVYGGDLVKVFLEVTEGYKELRSFKEFEKLAKEEKLSVCDYGSFIDITSENGTKGKGVEKLSNMFGINKDQVLVLGDGKNDISMINNFKNSFCPADASCVNEVLPHATILNRKHREGCIMEIVEKIGFKG